MPKKIVIIGSGFSSLSAACYLAQAGNEVHLYEKNQTLGGRARQLKEEGFTFDMGPSWYWMPDIFEKFFGDFNKKVSDFYQLEKLDPAYYVWFKDEVVTIGDTLDKIATEFERIEPGSSPQLKKFIKNAGVNYDIAINDVVNKPGLSPFELVTPETAVRVNQFFKTISDDVRKSFKNEKLVSILEFPVLFLGAKPNNTPAFYRFMNYADFGLGTWHPKGGMHEVIKGMIKLAHSLGVKTHTSAGASKILVDQGKVQGIVANGETITADYVVSGADYHHSETLLDPPYRQYTEKYWDSRVFAPSSLLFYVGFDKKFDNVAHHNLFFDTDFDQHARTIYDDLAWPEEPLFYANFPSVSDETMAPEGKENGFFLIPIAPGVEDTQALRDQYFDIIMERLERLSGQNFRNHIIFKKSFCVDDFVSEYNSYKGNAYGMANTLKQTAFLRPNLRSKKVKNLYFTGQLTVPGPGVPPALISGKLVSQLISKSIK
ncbi:phytoene desaturase family protein [Dokdonia donghaensis]|uniref:Phytoene dehydrogenase n=1 Tax=Dokdonia donghaensis DSW-1 TaxID=1300343 RepID=A0A0A2GZ40_9FLAO|nr:oleate hydratase [Dokdonia donghaensis]ANH60325.1 zeta-carotene-forming phytoene desaturase [Dokdonia donghaensis DSW-1]KGO07606.1 phytoene dehydrogenase [Dokdonia donghaensis DSW-1]